MQKLTRHNSTERLLLTHLLYKIPTNELLKTAISSNLKEEQEYCMSENQSLANYGPKKDVHHVKSAFLETDTHQNYEEPEENLNTLGTQGIYTIFGKISQVQMMLKKKLKIYLLSHSCYCIQNCISLKNF